MNNGNRYSSAIKQQALVMRDKGATMYEIADAFAVSPNTACKWIQGRPLTDECKAYLARAREKKAAEASARMTRPENRAHLYTAEVLCKRHSFVVSRREKYIEDWKAGKISGGKSGGHVSDHVRKYLFDKYNSKCARCGWAERNIYSDTIPIEVEHIDGDYLNNSEANLTLLCPSCHSLTPTYRSLNRGKGRKGLRPFAKKDVPASSPSVL